MAIGGKPGPQKDLEKELARKRPAIRMHGIVQRVEGFSGRLRAEAEEAVVEALADQRHDLYCGCVRVFRVQHVIPHTRHDCRRNPGQGRIEGHKPRVANFLCRFRLSLPIRSWRWLEFSDSKILWCGDLYELILVRFLAILKLRVSQNFKHCSGRRFSHVNNAPADAGPARRELSSAETIQICVIADSPKGLHRGLKSGVCAHVYDNTRTN
jgi:hypothetical protein